MTIWMSVPCSQWNRIILTPLLSWEIDLQSLLDTASNKCHLQSTYLTHTVQKLVPEHFKHKVKRKVTNSTWYTWHQRQQSLAPWCELIPPTLQTQSMCSPSLTKLKCVIHYLCSTHHFLISHLILNWCRTCYNMSCRTLMLQIFHWRDIEVFVLNIGKSTTVNEDVIDSEWTLTSCTFRWVTSW